MFVIVRMSYMSAYSGIPRQFVDVLGPFNSKPEAQKWINTQIPVAGQQHHIEKVLSVD